MERTRRSVLCWRASHRPCTRPTRRDHRALDAVFAALRDAMSVHDPLETARATKAFKFHLDLHLDKEDAHMYRLIRERVPLRERGRGHRRLANSAPPERFPEVVAWMLPLLDIDDRVIMTLGWKHVMPAAAFAETLPLIQQAAGEGWTDLAQRIPQPPHALRRAAGDA